MPDCKGNFNHPAGGCTQSTYGFATCVEEFLDKSLLSASKHILLV